MLSRITSYPREMLAARTGRLGALCLAIVLLVLLATSARAEEVIPAKPTRYFNDFALTVKPETADRLNKELEAFEQATSNQIVAVIYPQMQSDSSVEDYCQRVARSWEFGQKDKKNGAVLFVFLNNHKVWIATGYGLEGPLPDALCKRIISDEITPRFKANDFDGGMTAGVKAMMQAAKGEYKGTGATNYQRNGAGDSASASATVVSYLFVFAIIGIVFWVRRRSARNQPGAGGTMYTGGSGPVFLPMNFGGSSGGGGGGLFGGGGSSSDGGGFISSGGGDFGGGGAGGDW